ncbi:39S ribosomal protein L9, mitochondrial [Anthonomus grandis grandis]|uniref:39S ribosomal protein L9, mitochondrial n=1 Tax=Anthonomus grandis grandis TaxID=2921223 RepID=UPI002166B769|nr:39S ribosomal protein L9, mitochondrial [Anthonomus grandis grandis]
MWKNCTRVVSKAFECTSVLGTVPNFDQQIRTTYILKRKFAPRLHKKGNDPKALKAKHFIYELVKDTSAGKQPLIDVILTSYVSGLGNIGDKVLVRQQYAYNNLLLPGLAVYASEENLEKFRDYVLDSNADVHFSSANAVMMMDCLARMTLSVVMNKEQPWTIEPWHITASFRKCGYVVPEYAVKLPEKQISGPDMSLEGKEFFVTVMINKTETVNVRCVLHHWSTDIKERLPYLEKFWLQEKEPIDPAFQPVLEKIPKKTPRKVQQ